MPDAQLTPSTVAPTLELARGRTEHPAPVASATARAPIGSAEGTKPVPAGSTEGADQWREWPHVTAQAKASLKHPAPHEQVLQAGTGAMT